MPVGLKPPQRLLPIPGIRLGTACAAIKQTRKDDLTVIECAPGTQVAAVFTRNRFCAAPVIVAREHLRRAPTRALIINSGNANCGTGEPGLAAARDSCDGVAGPLDIDADQVLPFSTGVISETLPVERILSAIADCIASLKEDNWLAAARAIMTTDVIEKGCSRRIELDGVTVSVTGIVKGSGMIRPDMATMLCYVALDANVSRPLLQHLLEHAVEQSFHRITVDGDTSTNDSCVLLATGKAGNPRIETDADPRFAKLQECLNAVLLDLAQSVVRDGEGATKFVEIRTRGAATLDDALAVGFTVAHSPLVKTALFASDPNVGRILMAVGRSGVAGLSPENIGFSINDVDVVENGVSARTYTEARGQAAMQGEEIVICIDLGMGDAGARVWTCDFSYDYVKINAEYRS